VKLRTVTAAMTLVLATAGLSACTSKVGVAAVVGSHRITESTVSGYVQQSGTTTTAAANSIPPKVQVLATLIQSELFAAALSVTTGGIPSAEALAKYHDAAVVNVLQIQAVGANADRSISTQIVTLGYKARFTAEIIRSAELEYLLVKRINAASLADLQKAISPANQSVQVSQRYGKWDPKQLLITTANHAGYPSFMKFPTSAASTGS
jgi:hypothetical protein